ncbi:hypothetical protein GQR58_013114 [Nymphon striatum]|nr:hypothetical protein GQR58_013114 [Nymphon striatum]
METTDTKASMEMTDIKASMETTDIKASMETTDTKASTEMTDTKADSRKKRRENIWILTAVGAYSLCSFGISCINPFYPEAATLKGMSASLIGIILCSVYIPQMVLFPFTGKLSNLEPLLRRRTWNFRHGFPSHDTRLASWSAFEEVVRISCHSVTSRLEAMLETGAGIGYTVGPLFGGIVYEKLNFESPLIIAGALGFSVFLLSFITMKDVPKKASGDAVDEENINYLKSFLKAPAFYIICVTNILPFVMITNYDISFVLYASFENIPQDRFSPINSETQNEINIDKESILSEEIRKIKKKFPANTMHAVAQAKEKGASSWLNALPLEEQGFVLNKGELRNALALPYNEIIKDLPSKCPCGETFNIDHRP